MKAGLILVLIIVIGSAVFLFSKQNTTPEINVPITTTGTNSSTTTPDPNRKDIEVIADSLNIPWEIVFLPSGEMLITERPGTLLKIGTDRQQIKVQGVHHVGEGGLLGVALHPDFELNQYLYLYLTSQENGAVVNRVERYKFDGNSLSDRQVILQGIKGSSNHDGGRIKFGPDGYLYIATGDAENPNSAQDTSSLNGKILRVSAEGSIPNDNPFRNAVYSYGHRNVQGLAWDEQGKLWATEHGPSGLQTGNDELNLIEKGNNYGWPTIKGDQIQSEMITPIIQSGNNDTWAPSGAAYQNGSIFFAGLRGATLYEAKLEGEKITQLVKHFENEYGRLRTVGIGPEGDLYFLTNNTDGRGRANKNDDKLIRINPEILDLQ